MKELQVGFMSTQDLAAWFNISYGSFRNKSSTWYARLEQFCRYTRVHGGVEITEVFIPIYTKKLQFKDDKAYMKMVLESPYKLSSVAGIVRKLQEYYPEYQELTESQLCYKMRKAGITGYGNMKDEEPTGVYGKRRKTWAIKVSDLNEYRFMTAQEQEIYNELMQNIHLDKKIIEDAAWLYQTATESEAIEDDNNPLGGEYKRIIGEIGKTFYNSVLLPFKMRTGGAMLVAIAEYEVFESQLKKIVEQEIAEQRLAEIDEHLEILQRRFENKDISAEEYTSQFVLLYAEKEALEGRG